MEARLCQFQAQASGGLASFHPALLEACLVAWHVRKSGLVCGRVNIDVEQREAILAEALLVQPAHNLLSS